MLNNDYILRSDIQKAIGDWFLNDGDKRSMMQVFEDIPAADVEPVAHGYWVKSTGMMPPEFAGNYHCSECGWHGINAKEREYKRCPECGAKMLPEPPKGEDHA